MVDFRCPFNIFFFFCFLSRAKTRYNCERFSIDIYCTRLFVWHSIYGSYIKSLLKSYDLVCTHYELNLFWHFDSLVSSLLISTLAFLPALFLSFSFFFFLNPLQSFSAPIYPKFVLTSLPTGPYPNCPAPLFPEPPPHTQRPSWKGVASPPSTQLRLCVLIFVLPPAVDVCRCGQSRAGGW